MAENPPYNIADAFAYPNQTFLIYFGKGEVNTILENVGEITKVDVVMFPYMVVDTTEVIATGGPRRGQYKGKIISALFNEKQTKGHVVFEDGTIMYHDSTFLA